MKLNIPYLPDDKLPSLIEIKRGMLELENEASGITDFKELKELFFNKIPIFPFLIHPKGTIKMPLYRVCLNDYLGFDHTSESTFSHPPKEFTIKGRCNLDGHPVFYASVSQDAAINEKRKSDGSPLELDDVIYISCWTIDDDCECRYSQFIYGKNIELGETVSELNEINKVKLKEIAKSYSKDKQDAFEYLVHKFGEYFVSENYSLSSFLCHNFLYHNRDKAPISADAIFYPSIQKGLTDFNVAIHPEFVKKHMKLKEVQKVRISAKNETGTRVEVIESGVITEHGNLEWIPSIFNVSNLTIQDLEIGFKDIAPPSEKYSSSNEFRYKGMLVNLESICWDYLNKNHLRVLLLLYRDLDFSFASHEKRIQINFLTDELTLHFKGAQYVIETLNVTLSFIYSEN